jgi:hypothetical protein
MAFFSFGVKKAEFFLAEHSYHLMSADSNGWHQEISGDMPMSPERNRLIQRNIAALATKYEKQLPAGKSRVEVRDEVQPGLQVHFKRTGRPGRVLSDSELFRR